MVTGLWRGKMHVKDGHWRSTEREDEWPQLVKATHILCRVCRELWGWGGRS